MEVASFYVVYTDIAVDMQKYSIFDRKKQYFYDTLEDVDKNIGI